MTTYAIGDVQGCYDELQRLLDHIAFDSGTDRLWFVGDLVNRGPNSVGVLRFVRDLGKGAVVVLGNHDLHLLALSQEARGPMPQDRLEDVLKAPDRDELIDWLRRRPLMHYDKAMGFALLHAGLPPQWDIPTALKCAGEVEKVLRGAGFSDFCRVMYGNQPQLWSENLSGIERLRFTVNCLTRLRYCSFKGELALDEKGLPGMQRKGNLPWYMIPHRASRQTKIVFGHWSTLGYQASHNVWALDTGCIWGGNLTALELGSHPQPTHIPCPGGMPAYRF